MFELNWRSVVLAAGALHGLVIAFLLVLPGRNRVANVCLAGFLLVFIALITPYVIGFAGFFQAWPWLSFAPWDLVLFSGPLLWFHVHALVRGRLPRRWAMHLLPGLAQLAYYLWAFAHPLAWKNAWDGAWHAPLIEPIESALELASLAAYLLVTARLHRAYREWLARNRSDADEYRLPWIPWFIGMVAATFAAYLATEAINTWAFRLGYEGFFWFYLWLSVAVYALGVQGWRHVNDAYPPLPGPGEVTAAAQEPPDQEAPSGGPAERDWSKLGAQWASRLRDGEWWRDADLDLPTVARRLGTNTAYLSRALNQGVGQRFNDVVNACRVDAVCAGLAETPERGILDLALDCGFRSKTSFNRAFRQHTGQTPSAWRARQAAKIDPKGTES